MQERLWRQIRQGVEYGGSGYSKSKPSLELEIESDVAIRSFMLEPKQGMAPEEDAIATVEPELVGKLCPCTETQSICCLEMDVLGKRLDLECGN